MTKKICLVFLATTSLAFCSQPRAQSVTIIRDDWGIAHVYGKTDAEAVFGMIYAQAEDDFNRIETNYLNSLGRLAEAEGESKIYQDLRMKLFIDTATLKTQYAASPAWLKSLMDAWASGLNFYLANHPEVKPRVIQHFEPWMALSFTEGSIGGDIERINLDQLKAFYGKTPVMSSALEDDDYEAEPSGSNGIAIAPSNTLNHHALLLINPHTSFFFRSELQMVSGEGLNAYGAVTWGQFFIYQGFNQRAGWMHTSSGVDAVDEYAETVIKKGDGFVYKYGNAERPVISKEITVPYKSANGMAEKHFTVYRTAHGPIVREVDGKWVSIRLMQEPIKALTQSYLRTKATNYLSYRKTMELKANSSNNTIFADADGDIAYFHGNFIPRRDTRFDWTKPVDGSDPATEWQGLLALNEIPQLLNPQSGWLYNCNNWPWSAAGDSSPKKENFPVYVETGAESPRGLHAIRLLKDKKDFTPDSLIAAAYDSYLPWFDKTIPALIKASDAAPVDRLAEQIRVLRAWDFRWAVDSVPTSLAIFWGEEIRRQVSTSAKAAGLSTEDFIAARVPPEQLLSALSAASDKLVADFGKWQTPWGEINRFQRLTGDIVQPFSDSAPSIPVGFASGNWGSLASFGAHAYPGTKKWYGTGGNSFVAVVEFGEKVHARAVTAGGESGHPTSPHFNDEAERYSTGNLREVYFYRSDLNGHTEREYHPGDSDKTIKVTNAAQVQSTRAALVKYIWGTSWADVAQKQPLGVEHNYSPKPEDAIPSGVENLKSIDKIDVSMGKVRSVAYVFYPDQKSLHKTVVLQQGHGCTLTDDGDKPVHLDLAIHKLVAAGYTVAALRMPNFQTPAACGPDGVHDKLFATPLKSGIAVQFFMEPVARTINYLVKHRPDLEEFDMVGLSGGGWTTTLYAALDPRVIKSFPVAGTLPLYLRGDHYNHDLEQYFNPLYKIAGYKDLYVLGAAGVGRMQVQILNRYDDCCFGENQHTVGPPSYLDSVREYEHDVQSTLRSMQSRGFSLHIDESAHYHQISPEAIEKVIIPVLNGEAPPAS